MPPILISVSCFVEHSKPVAVSGACCCQGSGFSERQAAYSEVEVWTGRDVVLSDDGIAFFTSITIGRGGEELIFTRNEYPWKKSDQARPMRAACEHARIAPAVSFHSPAPHLGWSLAVMGGMPMMVVARNLGYRDTRMVELHYGHFREDCRRAVKDHAPRYGLDPPTRKVQPIR